MKWFALVTVVLVVILGPARARGEAKYRGSYELTPQYRKLNQAGYSPRTEVYDVYGMLSGQAEWSKKNWTFEAKPEVRMLLSRGVGTPAPEAASVKTSRRLLGFRRTLSYEADGESYADMDRFNLRYTSGSAEFFAGRKPISLGVLRFFPVWNKLTMPLIFNPGPEWIENPDVAGFSFQPGRFSYRAFASRGGTAKVDDIALAESHFFGTGIDLLVLAGTWWQHTAAGVAGAVDALDSTWRFEGLWFSRYHNQPSQGQLGLGFERAFGEKWTLIVEGFTQSAGLSRLQNVVALPNRFMALGGKFYLLPYTTYQLSAVWSVRFGALANLARDASYVGLLDLERSLSDNVTLTFKVKQPFGSSRGEFGDERVVSPIGHMGMASTIMAQLQSTF